MVFKFKKPQLGDTRTKITYCIIPRKFKSDTHYVFLWFHKLEIKQRYVTCFLRDDSYEDRWETISESYKQ